MIRVLSGAALALVMLGTAGSAAPTANPNGDHAYTQGSVWKISYVQTKPGKFDAYINDMSRVFERFQEAQKAKGRVLSYKVLRLSDARDNEPNLILMIEYPSYAAALDTPDAVWDQARKEIFGSMKNLDSANIDREMLRTLRGDVFAQELHVPVQK